MNKLYSGDCIEGMRKLAAESVDLAMTDPPYNIGFDYGGEYDDKRTALDYLNWSHEWLAEVARVLKPTGSFWLAIGDEWQADLQIASRHHGFHLRSHVVWYYTFGVNSAKKLSRSHAHLLYFTKHKKKFTFNTDACRVPSARALVYHDKRANPAGRLPDDTWIIRPQELDDQAFPEFADTWHIPRIAGTFHQRIEDAPNQMPEQLVARAIRFCSNEGEIVLDPFAGTGTTLVVAKKLNRQYLGYELSDKFASRVRQRLKGARPGDPLDGPIPQGS